jgi:hypothetical protein
MKTQATENADLPLAAAVEPARLPVDASAGVPALASAARADEPAAGMIDAVASAVEAAATAEDDEELQKYMEDLMQRLGSTSSGNRTERLPPPLREPIRLPPPPRPLPQEPPPRESSSPDRSSAAPVRTERAPERVEQFTAMRDVANEHTRSLLIDYTQKKALLRLHGRWMVAALGSLCVLILLGMAASGSPFAYYAAWAAHLVAVVWTVRFVRPGKNVSKELAPPTSRADA